MKVTVEISDAELREVSRLTGEKKKGPAIRKLVVDAITMRKREEIVAKFISGEFSAELKDFEQARAADRKRARRQASRWRDDGDTD